MCDFHFLSDYSWLMIMSFVGISLTAGFIDAVVGGGGLIQIPALLIGFPNTAIASAVGTNKIAGLSGTSVSALQYAKRIRFDYKILFLSIFFAFIASYLGAKTLSLLPAENFKPIIFFILIVIAIYTYSNKNLGKAHALEIPYSKKMIMGCVVGIVVGYYDGFFGPGAGSFFVFGFVLFLGFEFVEASAYSKIINCCTNISALIVFVKQGDFILDIAILMAICNIIGNYVGSKIALKKGNEFVRKVFLIVVGLMICRYGYDIFIK